ncbi:hypothetical protein B0H63DRAFT_489237 [Podospora didyma]|uniref:Uncharacterized protein n=1 Tax=Podospora didyma TaxID=330526 RepID=A0AAE0N1J1_9PEZI|nr:hypothetical protein B0H63DRAFT_489237 [Podospora didyma]
MADPDFDRPGSSAAGGYHASSLPPQSPRPLVARRASQSSLQRARDPDRDRQHEPPPRPTSAAHSLSHSPQPSHAAYDAQASPPPPPRHQIHSPSFSPLFALLSSSTHPSQRQTTHHPTVHYIFADDDPEVLTTALAQHHRVDEYEGGEDDDMDNPHDRAVILDMAPTKEEPGYEVAWASSLSPDWAVVSARLSPMGGGGDGGGGGTAGGRSGSPGALVLRIEGMSVEPTSSLGKTPTPEAELQSSGGSGARRYNTAPDDYTGLLHDFEKRMRVLRRVVDAGSERQRKALADDDQQNESIGRDRGIDYRLAGGDDDAKDPQS